MTTGKSIKSEITGIFSRLQKQLQKEIAGIFQKEERPEQISKIATELKPIPHRRPRVKTKKVKAKAAPKKIKKKTAVKPIAKKARRKARK